MEISFEYNILQLQVNEENKNLMTNLLKKNITDNQVIINQSLTEDASAKLVSKLVKWITLFDNGSYEENTIYIVIVSFLHKNKKQVQKSDINGILETLEQKWHVLIDCLNDFKKKQTFLLLMNVISTVCYGNGSYISLAKLDWLLSIKTGFKSVAMLAMTTENFEIRKVSLQCIKNVCITSSKQDFLTKERLLNCIKVFIYILKLDSVDTLANNYCLTFTALRGLKFVFENSNICQFDNFTEILTSLKKVIGKSYYPVSPAFDNNYLSNFGQSSSSESDFSDNEIPNNKGQRFTIKSRHFAFDCLQLIINGAPKDMIFKHWCLLLIEDYSLLSILANDRKVKFRNSAAIIICNILESGNNYLPLSIQDYKTEVPFISYSATMTSLICKVHEVLITCLKKESSVSTVLHILRALAIIASSTPYAKLQPELVLNVVSSAKDVLLSPLSSTAIQFSALSVFTSLLNNPSKVSVFFDSLKQNSTDSWLVDFCTKLCPEYGTSKSIPVAALQTLTAISKSYFSLMINYKDVILDMISSSTRDPERSWFLLNVCKLLESIGKSLVFELQNSDLEVVEFGEALWNSITTKLLPHLKSSSDDQLNIQFCDLLSIIGNEMYEKLPKQQQELCINSLFDLANHENYLVRSSSIRCFALFIIFPSLKKDPQLMERMSYLVLNLVSDSNKRVQNNAAWAFANLTDSLVLCKHKNLLQKNFLKDEILEKFFETVLTLYPNKEKIRFNMMRILGNLLRLLSSYHLSNPSFSSKVIKSREFIISALTTAKLMKVRWNACIALGKFLYNPNIPVDERKWSENIYSVLNQTILESKNFKVKTKACAALCCIRSKKRFGDYFQTFCFTVFDQLHEVDSKMFVVNFDKYQMQLLFTAAHLVSLMDQEDFSSCLERLKVNRNNFYVRYLVKYSIEELEKMKLSTTDDIENEDSFIIATLSPEENIKSLKEADAKWKSMMQQHQKTHNELLHLFTITD